MLISYSSEEFACKWTSLDKILSEHCEGSGNTKLLTRWDGQYSLKHLIIDYNDLFSDAASCSFSKPTVSKICALLKAAESWHLMFDYCDVFSDAASCSFSEPTVSKICALLKAVHLIVITIAALDAKGSCWKFEWVAPSMIRQWNFVVFRYRHPKLVAH